MVEIQERLVPWGSMTIEDVQDICPLQRDALGWSAVHWAACYSTRVILEGLREKLFRQHQNHELFELELNRAAGPAGQTLTPLALAVKYNKGETGEKLIRWMLSNGAQIHSAPDMFALQQLARTHENISALNVLTSAHLPSTSSDTPSVPRLPHSPARRLVARKAEDTQIETHLDILDLQSRVTRLVGKLNRCTLFVMLAASVLLISWHTLTLLATWRYALPSASPVDDACSCQSGGATCLPENATVVMNLRPTTRRRVAGSIFENTTPVGEL